MKSLAATALISFALLGLATSTTARAAEPAGPSGELWPAVHTGLSAPDVGPIVFGIVAEGVHMATFAGCFLALDDNQTCAEIAGKARDKVTAEAVSPGLSGASAEPASSSR
jgi:hypothetical protein